MRASGTAVSRTRYDSALALFRRGGIAGLSPLPVLRFKSFFLLTGGAGGCLRLPVAVELNEEAGDGGGSDSVGDVLAC